MAKKQKKTVEVKPEVEEVEKKAEQLVPVNDTVLAAINNIKQQANAEMERVRVQMTQQFQAQINQYIVGVRTALNVPDGWLFDESKKGFVPGEE